MQQLIIISFAVRKCCLDLYMLITISEQVVQLKLVMSLSSKFQLFFSSCFSRNLYILTIQKQSYQGITSFEEIIDTVSIVILSWLTCSYYRFTLLMLYAWNLFLNETVRMSEEILETYQIDERMEKDKERIIKYNVRMELLIQRYIV